jgi:hypothetical protein
MAHHPTSQHFFLRPHLILIIIHYFHTNIGSLHLSRTFFPASQMSDFLFPKFLRFFSRTLTSVTYHAPIPSSRNTIDIGRILWQYKEDWVWDIFVTGKFEPS